MKIGDGVERPFIPFHQPANWILNALVLGFEYGTRIQFDAPSVKLDLVYVLKLLGIIRILFQAILLILLAFFLIDFISAVGSSDCSAPPGERTHDCFPWGMTEGPMEGGSWNYMNKTRYLATSAIMCAGLALAICISLIVKGNWLSLILMNVMSFGGIWILIEINKIIFTMLGW